MSIGYKGVAVSGTEEWFDERRGIMQNQHGKVDNSTTNHGGLYVSGWLKRGPSGIIGTNIADAKDTVASIVKDLTTSTAASVGEKHNNNGIENLLEERGVAVVKWSNFEKIDVAETSEERKRSKEQPREKFATLDGLLSAAFS